MESVRVESSGLITYESSDLKDRYESRMRTMLDTKIQGQIVQPGAAPATLDSNVIDLMVALRRALVARPRPSGSQRRLRPE